MIDAEIELCDPVPCPLGRGTDELVDALYERLYKLARRQLSTEAADHSFETGDLVHEVYLRLVKTERAWDGPAHLAMVAAEMMQWILTERARSKRCIKRGGRNMRVSLTDVSSSTDPHIEEILLVDDLLDAFQTQHPREAQLVQLHYFAGLSVSEAGRVLGISSSTAHRYWTFARAWLRTAVDGNVAAPLRGDL